MKESSGKTKKLSKGVRRARSMRNVVMMVLVCVLLLSAATYAWFTLSTSAKVANLSMTVGEETSLQIAPDLDRDGTGRAGDYGSILTFGANLGDGIDTYWLNAPLLPATMNSDGIVYKPEYDENDGTIITGFEALEKSTSTEILKDSISTTEATNDYFYYRTSFYLKTAGSENVTVELKTPTGTDMNAYTAPTNGVGTYIITETKDGMGAAAIRIKLSVGDDAIVYEPMNDIILDSNKAYESATISNTATKPSATTSTDVQKSTGEFTQHTGTLEVTPAGVRVTMEIWLEGNDPQCVNQIMGDVIKGQIAFAVQETAATNP